MDYKIIQKCFSLSRRCTNSLLLAASSTDSLIPSFGTYSTVLPCILYRVSVRLAINLCSCAEKSFFMPGLWSKIYNYTVFHCRCREEIIVYVILNQKIKFAILSVYTKYTLGCIRVHSYFPTKNCMLEPQP